MSVIDSPYGCAGGWVGLYVAHHMGPNRIF